jgi:small subunit ribosomal protein S4
LQLREKQKLRRSFGILERPFRNYFFKADKQKGVTGTNLLVILETRLDNVIYRMGYANSRDQARQLIRHGHFFLNGSKVNVPSLRVRVGDELVVRESSRKVPVIQEARQVIARRGTPSWMEVDSTQHKGKIVAIPTREDISFQINEQLVVELYSK